MTRASNRKKRLGILVGGGPAPGINSVISATIIEAINSGLQVVAIYDGFEPLRQSPPGAYVAQVDVEWKAPTREFGSFHVR